MDKKKHASSYHLSKNNSCVQIEKRDLQRSKIYLQEQELVFEN